MKKYKFKNITQSVKKTNYSFNHFFHGSKRRKNALYCSEKFTGIIKSSNVKTQWWLLLLKFSSFV